MKYNLEQDLKSGLWYRPILKEDYIIKEQNQYALDFKNRIFMDVGANIGSTSRMAISKGAISAHCFECHPDTFEVLEKNKVTEMVLYNVALMNDGIDKIDFYVSNKYSGDSSVIPSKNRQIISVPVLPFWKELERIKPSVLKIDIEGAEYSFMDKELPEYVEEFAIELHLRKNEDKEKAVKIAELFENWHYHRAFRFNWYITTLVLSRNRPGKGLVKNRLIELKNKHDA